MVKPSPKSTGMSLRTILIHPDPRLKKVADPVARVTPEIESLAADLLGWRAGRGLDEMLADHWRWQQRHPDGYAAR